MYLKSMTVTDYSTGSSYSYGDKSGKWQSIVAEGGKINGNQGAEPTSTESAPQITATVDDAPVPWSGTHRETSTWVTPDVWPWVASGSPGASSTGYQYDWESGACHNKPPAGGSASEHFPAPFIGFFSSSSINHHSFPSQSTFQFMSAASPSSSVACSPFGVETSWSTASQSATSTSTSTEPITATTLTTTRTSDVATMASGHHATPSVGSADSQRRPSMMTGMLCALLGGVFAWL